MTLPLKQESKPMSAPSNPFRVMVYGRLAFPSPFELKPRAQGLPPTHYQTSILLPPNTDLKPLAEAVKAAMVKKFGKPIQLKDKGNPIRKAEAQEYAGYAPGWWEIRSSSERKIPVVGPDKLPITDKTQVWGGQWANVILSAYGWGPNAGGQGVSFELGAIQIAKPGADSDPGGARLDGRGKPVDPDEVFTALELPAEEAGAPGTSDWNPFAT